MDGPQTAVVIGEAPSCAEVARVANGAPVTLSAAARERVTAARAVIARMVESGRTIYGVTTGFGGLANTTISPEDASQLQRNLVMSHAAGTGNLLSREVVRAAMFVLAGSLARGHSGIRLSVLELLIELLNRGVTPIVPSQGSLGASGDLAPLAHMALVLIGQGEAEVAGERLPGAAALERVGLSPTDLGPKEGVSLCNGTHVMTALGALYVEDARRLAKTADVIMACSGDALGTPLAAFDPRLHALRRQPGQQQSAANIRRLLDGSGIIPVKSQGRVQDAYSLRCTPQVHGAVRDALDYAAGVVERELGAVTDNPLVFAETEEVLSGGNFHGEPLAFALDVLKMSIAELANISERRIERLLNTHLSGLPAFLTPRSGLNSGLMIAQYTAAALVSENKVLAHPASVDSIPTSAGQEDHVSMGMTAGLLAGRVLRQVETALALEMLCAAQAIDLCAPLTPAPGTGAAQARFRQAIPTLEHDRPLAPDIATAHALVHRCALVAAAEAVVGALA